MTATPNRSDLAPPTTARRSRPESSNIGVGGFHRAHQAMYVDRLMRDGSAPGGPHETRLDWGICGVGLLPGDTRMRDALASQDHTYTLTLKHPDGRHESTVIGSIHDFLFAPDDPEAVLEPHGRTHHADRLPDGDRGRIQHRRRHRRLPHRDPERRP